MNSESTILTDPNYQTLRFDIHRGDNLSMATRTNDNMAFDSSTSRGVSDFLMEEHNQNPSITQEELLKWHWKLEYFNFQKIQAKLSLGSILSIQDPICQEFSFSVQS